MNPRRPSQEDPLAAVSLNLGRCGRTAQTAIACASLLAEAHAQREGPLNSAAVARRRDLPAPLVAKVLTTLSMAGIVDGARGPGGGYWLAKPPGEVSLQQIVAAFERPAQAHACPFGPDWCASGKPCPLHNRLAALGGAWTDYMRNTTLAVFTQAKPVARVAYEI